MSRHRAETDDSETAGRMRLDKWLWHARFCKSRTLATALCGSGKLRLNGALIAKAHARIAPGDTLTFPLAGYIRVIRVLALTSRRGPAPEAQACYEDLQPPAPANRAPRPRLDAAGSAGTDLASPAPDKRPDGRARRQLSRLRGKSMPHGED